MKIVTCCVCATVFQMTDALYRDRTDDGKLFYCPNGHEQYFTESSASKIKTLEKEIGRLLHSFERETLAHNYTIRQLRSVRGVVTKLKRQIAEMKGVRDD